MKKRFFLWSLPPPPPKKRREKNYFQIKVEKATMLADG